LDRVSEALMSTETPPSPTPVAPSPDQDTADLAGFGYKQELKRSLGLFSSFAVAFSYISPSTGIFTLYFLGLVSLGGILFWTWPVVVLGQMFVALNFAELSSHYPVAGSVFQWTKYLSGRHYSWFTGWIYLFAGVITVAAVVATLPIALLPALNSMFNTHFNVALGSHDELIVAVITLLVITVLNIYGVKLVAVISNTGVIFEILGMVVFAFVLALRHNHQGVGVIFKSGGIHVTPSLFLVGMFMSLFVVYGFDTASTLAEETKNPRKEAPRAVLASIIGAFVIGAIFIWGTLMAIPSFKTAIGGFWGPGQIIGANFSSAFATVYLLVVAAAIFICCMSIMTATVRLTFGMARDDQLPLAKTLSKVNPRLHTPIGACIAVALLSAIPFLQFTGPTVIAVAATAMIYLSYLLGNLAVFRARLRGWPKKEAPFKLGRWGLVVNSLALLWGGSMLVNFLWPARGNSAFASDATFRVFSNPNAIQSDYITKGHQLVNFHVGFLNHIPIIELMMGVVIIVGAIYYFAVQTKKPYTPLVIPDEVAPLSA
jgi:amino acid transporter